MTPSEQDTAVLEYLRRESIGVTETVALAGLKLSAYRMVRARLVDRGLLVKTTSGRYVPVGEVTS